MQTNFRDFEDDPDLCSTSLAFINFLKNSSNTIHKKYSKILSDTFDKQRKYLRVFSCLNKHFFILSFSEERM